VKLIKAVEPRCKCFDKLWNFFNANGAKWNPGTVVQCDCGVYYTRAEDQRDGFYWRKSYDSEIDQCLKPAIQPSVAEYCFLDAAE
jgi:hypothetical protein